MQSEGSGVVKSTLGLVVFLALTFASCATGRDTGTDATSCYEAGDHAIDKPLDLTVELPRQAAIGERIQVTYRLMNESDIPLAACPSGLNDFHLINNRTKATRGLIMTSTGISPANMIRVPAHGSVTWTREVEIPDVGAGEATFFGLFDIGTARIKSKPVTVEILLSAHQGG
jgi:hypothetical protein